MLDNILMLPIKVDQGIPFSSHEIFESRFLYNKLKIKWYLL